MSRLFALASLLMVCTAQAWAADDFPPGPDSRPNPDSPRGELIKLQFKAGAESIFPGTERDVIIYLPQQLDRTKAAPFMVFQDGVIYQAPTVFDNLVHKKEVPPFVGIFIKPGVVPAGNADALPRFNRSFEYDSVSDRYARFLLDEVLPWVTEKHGIKLSDDPNARAIAGSSSGGICAFMVAWHRPDAFRRVFTSVGTYVGIHGADQMPVLVRKFEPKPLRIFLQSGTNDNNLYCGDWWMANQMMERSLTWAGYDVNHAWGEGGHNQSHATQIFPDVLRWLWRDYAEGTPIKANPRGDSRWKGYEVFAEDSSWKKTDLKGAYLDVDADGTVKAVAKPNARSVDAAGRSFDGRGGKGVKERVFTTLSPDQTLLYETTDSRSNVIICSQIQADGSIQFSQPFVRLDSLQEAHIQAAGMCVDADGRLYVATAFGLQVCDQAGRVNFIVPTPGKATDVCFGGAGLSELHIACGDSVYVRTTKVRGVITKKQPGIKPQPPKL